MANDYVIEVDGISKVYRCGWWKRPRIDALREVSFQVHRGEIFGLLGPNGAGKTTFIKILLGIVRKTRGSATLLGSVAGSRRVRRNVGYLPEQLRIAPHHTAHTALDYYGRLNGMAGSAVRQSRDELLARVGLQEFCKVSVKRFSKGMLQRLGLAQALLHRPQLLILDEPTDGLDPIGRSEVRSILTELRGDGRTVFLNSHLLQEVEMICDRVAVLDQGSLRYVGSVDEATTGIGGTEQIRLKLELQGHETEIRAALDSKVVDKWNETQANRYLLELHMPDQATVDQCVDGLRRAQISIVGLTRQRATLEDAFLKMLTDERTGKEDET